MKKQLFALCIVGMSLIGCAHTKPPAGYSRCPDQKKFPGLVCCKREETFAPTAGGCIPNEIANAELPPLPVPPKSAPTKV